MKQAADPRPRLTRQTLGLYLGVAKKQRPRMIATYLASAVVPFLQDVILPLQLGLLVDGLIASQRNSQQIYDTFWLIALVSVGGFLATRLTFFFRNQALTRSERELNLLVFRAYQRQEYSFFANNFVGSLVARSQRFVRTFQELLDVTAFNLLDLIIQVLGAVIVLSFRAPLLAILFLVEFTVMVALIRVTGKRKTRLLRANAAAGSAVTAALADNVTNNLAVKVFSGGDREEAHFFGFAERRRQAFIAQAHRNEAIRAARSVIIDVFQLGALAALIYLALNNRISVGTILITQLYLQRIKHSLWDVSRISERLEESVADAAEMTEVIIRQPAVVDPADPLPMKVADGRVEMRGVDFNYTDGKADEALFKNLNLVIEPGQKVGLVGPSGGGKTTLTKLLLRFMDVQTGEITIDGVNIAQVRQDDLRDAIAYVPQEPVLFHRSVSENIGYGRPDATQADIVEAAKLAHAHDFITKLPEGYDTLVGERGVKLSGGEKQRVAIARAMLKRAPIVVLDEATSALDSRSEKAIVAALDNLMRGRTTIVIAHRLSTIRKLDRIIVLKDGQISEDGTHEQLLASQGLYADLWQHQSGEFLPED